MIIYIGVFAIILFSVIQLFWQVQFSDIKGRMSREIKENIVQSMLIINQAVRTAESIDTANSVFDSSTGVLSLQDDVLIAIDTYIKNISVGGTPVAIRKLRFTEGGITSYDLTSDHVDVTDFTITNLTQDGNPNVILINLTFSGVNPGSDYLYDHSFSVRTSVAVRKD